MRRWIDKIIGPRAKTLRRVFTAEKPELHVEVLQYPEGSGASGHLIELSASWTNDDGSHENSCFACICSQDLPAAIELMQEASEEIAVREGVRRLPTVRLRGTSFFVDDRLGELRDVNDPHNRLTFEGW